MKSRMYREDSDFPEMPRDFWNHPYNPITGFLYTKKQLTYRKQEKYFNQYKIHTEHD